MVWCDVIVRTGVISGDGMEMGIVGQVPIDWELWAEGRDRIGFALTMPPIVPAIAPPSDPVQEIAVLPVRRVTRNGQEYMALEATGIDGERLQRIRGFRARGRV